MTPDEVEELIEDLQTLPVDQRADRLEAAIEEDK